MDSAYLLVYYIKNTDLAREPNELAEIYLEKYLTLFLFSMCKN